MDLIKSIIPCNIDLNLAKVFYNNILQPVKHTANLIVLVAKQLFFTVKSLKKSLHISVLESEIEFIRKSEMYTAIRKGRLSMIRYNQRWNDSIQIHQEDVNCT